MSRFQILTRIIPDGLSQGWPKGYIKGSANDEPRGLLAISDHLPDTFPTISLEGTEGEGAYPPSPRAWMENMLFGISQFSGSGDV